MVILQFMWGGSCIYEYDTYLNIWFKGTRISECHILRLNEVQPWHTIVNLKSNIPSCMILYITSSCTSEPTNDFSQTAALSSTKPLLLHSLLKSLECDLWLIIRDLMAGTKHTQPAEVINSLKGTLSRAINSVWFDSLRSEGRWAIIINSVRNRKSAEPITDLYWVSVKVLDMTKRG